MEQSISAETTQMSLNPYEGLVKRRIEDLTLGTYPGPLETGVAYEDFKQQALPVRTALQIAEMAVTDLGLDTKDGTKALEVAEKLDGLLHDLGQDAEDGRTMDPEDIVDFYQAVLCELDPDGDRSARYVSFVEQRQQESDQ